MEILVIEFLDETEQTRRLFMKEVDRHKNGSFVDHNLRGRTFMNITIKDDQRRINLVTNISNSAKSYYKETFYSRLLYSEVVNVLLSGQQHDTSGYHEIIFLECYISNWRN